MEKSLSASRFLECRFNALKRLDVETLKFLLSPSARLSVSVDGLSKLDIIEVLVREHIISLD